MFYKFLNQLGKLNYYFHYLALIIPWLPNGLIMWLIPEYKIVKLITMLFSLFINLLQYFLIGFRIDTELKHVVIKASDYKDLGEEMAFKLHEPMHELHQKLYYIIKFLTWLFKNKSNPIPKQYMDEISALVTSYNNIYPHYVITQREVITMHLLADYGNLFGCTTVIKRVNGKLQILRILDWPSYGCLANYIYLVERHVEGLPITYSIAPVWMVGATTIWNELGHFYQMNVAKGNGNNSLTPSTFTNRMLAERFACSTYFYDTSMPYNLIASDGENVVIKSPYHGEVHLRDRNYVFSIANEGHTDHHDSFARTRIMTQLAQSKSLFECAQHPIVNKWDTQLAIVFEFGHSIKTHVKINNIFAAS